MVPVVKDVRSQFEVELKQIINELNLLFVFIFELEVLLFGFEFLLQCLLSVNLFSSLLHDLAMEVDFTVFLQFEPVETVANSCCRVSHFSLEVLSILERQVTPVRSKECLGQTAHYQLHFVGAQMSILAVFSQAKRQQLLNHP